MHGAAGAGANTAALAAQRGAAAAPGHRGGPALDARSSDLLRQLKATQDAMRLAAAEVDLAQEDEDADLTGRGQGVGRAGIKLGGRGGEEWDLLGRWLSYLLGRLVG